LEAEKIKLRERGIQEGEAFLNQASQSKVLDKILVRLAELYYQQSNDRYLEAMQNYDTLIEKYEKGEIDQRPPEPTKDYSRSLEMYEKIIKEFPHSELLDDAIYNKAFLYEELGKKEEALGIYQSLIDEFPDSPYVPESLMRIAEYYFNPPVNDIERAIEVYNQILAFKESPKYDEALYRLGWAYYRLNKLPEAVAYFTLLADDVERARKLDPGQRYTNPALRDESVEYIGISFVDYGGAEGAAEYIKSIGGRNYGLDILKKIGDVYMEEKEEYEKAIQAYQTLLTLYPNASQAPQIQAKIVEAYRRLDNDMMAYLSRKTLYTRYRPDTEWWNKNQSTEAREEVLKLAERSLRENINLLLQRAEQKQDADLYLQAVNDSRDYLQTFPADTNAPLIHWNMALTLDTKLKKYDQAYEEYLKISDRYWDTKYQKFAAKNAIALAKEAVSSLESQARVIREASKTIEETKETVGSKASFKDALLYPRKELTEAEQRLAQAYDNYIMLFPHEPETATILANAGALYYNNNQFPEALKYFNTLVKHFPSYEDLDYARYSIMECYFGKHDFKSSEIIARKLRDTASSPEIAAKARRRLAESIFLSAEALADSGYHLKACNEYVRVIHEVPDVEFADLALLNGALEYDKAREFRRAVETYDYLVDSYTNSRYFLDAMNNLAIDYGELDEPRNAALTYEKLSSLHSDSDKARDALYNASVFYVRAQDWESAIRVNKEFVKKYPQSEDADDLYYDMASYYLKLDELEKANEIYGEFAKKYPDSPRVVETYYRRGEYLRERNEWDKAEAEYKLAIAKNKELKARDIEPNDYFAAEALFSLTQLKYDEFDKIEFRLPQSQMAKDKKRKKDLLLEIVEGYTNVAAYGTLRLYEATYNIGIAYEEFAETWARQELPPMDETRLAVAQKEVNQTAAELYDRAVTSFMNSVEVLTRLANEYQQRLEDSLSARADSLSSYQVSMEDSTLRMARRWIERSKEKVSEIIYDIAELNYESVRKFLTAPLPEGLDKVTEMEYRNQVLTRAVKPLIDQIVEAH
ncbi:MAG: tetratricopeptide repeat protein, partial [candidate division KSB1 bacterium]|nr:tetratricopeptide repeat protein [candidate division KSB1 bacterium]